LLFLALAFKVFGQTENYLEETTEGSSGGSYGPERAGISSSLARSKAASGFFTESGVSECPEERAATEHKLRAKREFRKG